MKLNLGAKLSIIFLFMASSVHCQNKISVNLEEFKSLRVSGRIDLELIPSESMEMSISALHTPVDEVDIDMKDGELKISIRPKINKDERIKIKLPYKLLTSIDAAAGAVINSARDLATEDLELNASSGGKIELSIKAKKITVRISQVSDIILYGNVISQNVIVNTGGNYLAFDLDCQDTYIKVSSGSQAKVTASRIIEATANSKGFIAYIGDPVSAYSKTSLGGEIESFKTKSDTEIY